MDFFIVIIFLALVLIMAVVKNTTNAGMKAEPKYKEDADLVAKRPLTMREIECMIRLRHALPDNEIMSQVSFTSFMQVKANNPSIRQSMFNKISRKRCDFLVCDRSFKPLCIIELDDSMHDGMKDKKRDELVAKSGLRTIRINQPIDAKRLKFTSKGVTIEQSDPISA